MNCSCPFPAKQIYRPPHVAQPSLIEEIEMTVRQTGVDQRRGRIDNELEIQDWIPHVQKLSAGNRGVSA